MNSELDETTKPMGDTDDSEDNVLYMDVECDLLFLIDSEGYRGVKI